MTVGRRGARQAPRGRLLRRDRADRRAGPHRRRSRPRHGAALPGHDVLGVPAARRVERARSPGSSSRHSPRSYAPRSRALLARSPSRRGRPRPAPGRRESAQSLAPGSARVDATAEDDAAHAGRGQRRRDLARRLALAVVASTVPSPVTTRSNAARRRSRASSSTSSAPGTSSAPSDGERGAEAAGGARAGEVRVRRELGVGRQPALELADRPRPRRPSAARRAAPRRASGTIDVARDDASAPAERSEHLAQAGAAVDGRRAAEADEQPRGRPRAPQDQLAEAAARGASSGSSRAGVERERLGRLDHRASRPAARASAPRPAGRSVRDRPPAATSPPSARAQHVERALAAVGDRQRVDLAPGRAQPVAPARRRPRRRERTPLRLAGHASARTVVQPGTRGRRGAAVPRAAADGVGRGDAAPPHPPACRAARSERPSRARKISPTPTPTDTSIACSPRPKAKPVRVGDAVRARAAARPPPARRPMFPGQSGKIVATFISTSTSPAAGSGASMSKARMAAQTARSWHEPAEALEEGGDRGRRRARA